MFPTLKKLRQGLRDYMSYDAETEALNQAGDQIEVEMIHRRFAKQSRRGRYGY
ncbi:hypothetical protein [Kaistia algarum]|jgi:hypothetical protein|uniref:hypothetical protein n=1 Tax=Kaistia algarum TaxID=2083279 RepID=UPI0014038B00|nr:hypothetical protein [Kaistia algarum]MCX5512474.1 hypothetical protein [Kaistia algarum]